jgi:hypothetical protein
LILEYFLWRGKHEYAISNHYDRHCVWEEVAQNKRLNKFNHTIIDQQFQFYQEDGLTRFNESDPHRLLPSREWDCSPFLGIFVHLECLDKSKPLFTSADWESYD